MHTYDIEVGEDGAASCSIASREPAELTIVAATASPPPCPPEREGASPER